MPSPRGIIQGFLAVILIGGCSSGGSDHAGPTPVPRELAFAATPATILAGGHFSPAISVEVRDSDGVLVTASAASVSLHLAAGGGPGALTGPTVTTAHQGKASFATVSIDQPGSYTLVATSGGLDSAVSAAFTVQPLPLTATVDVGTLAGATQFRSVRNGSTNPAVDTIASTGTVTWVWRGSNHSVRATDGNFLSSGVQNATTQWVVNFIIRQTYRFDCSVHGSAMTGEVVVQ